MLTFESPFYEFAGVVVFRDHASPTTFHYLAPAPKLRRDSNGKPHLLLLKYRRALDAVSASPVAREALGGGFLMFGVDCALSEDARGTILRELSSRVPPGSGAINLVPALYTKGTVNIVALDYQKAVEGEPSGDPEAHRRFVRGVQGTATPSLLHHQEAIFSLALSSEAATLLEEAYRSELSPIGVMYELEFMGLRPALSVVAHIEMNKVYEAFKVGLQLGVHSGGTPTPTPSPTPTATPTPTTTAPGTSADASRPPVEGAGTGAGTATATTTGTGTSSGTTGQPPGSGSTPGTQVFFNADIGLTLESLKQQGFITIDIIRQQEGQSVDEMERNAMTLIRETVINQIFQPAMTAQPSAAQQIASAATAANQMMATTGQTNTGTTGGGTRVDIGFQLQYKKQDELRTADVDYSVIAPEKRTHSPNGFFSALLKGTEMVEHIREIDLDDPFFRTLDVEVSSTLTVTTGAPAINDFEAFDLRNVLVELQYGGTPDRPDRTGTVEFRADKLQPMHFLAPLQADVFDYRHRAIYSFGQSDRIAAQRPSAETAWRRSTSRALVVHPPSDVAMLRVFVEPGVIDWDIVEQIQTRLLYEDPGAGFRAERTFQITQTSTRQEWLVRLTNPALVTYRAQHVWHLKDRSEITGPVETHSTAQLVVNDSFVDRLPITVQPLVDKEKVARVVVELQYEDSANRLDIRKNIEMVGPDYRTQTVTLPIMDRRKREYAYRVLLVKTNGGAENQPERRTEQLSILVTEGGVYMDVTIMLLGEMAAHQIEALQVDLRTEPLEGDRQRVESHVFEPTTDKKKTARLLLRADRPTRFEYKTTVFSATRGPIEGDWTPHDNTNLVLQVARLVTP